MFQVLLIVTNNSIKQQTYAYTWLIDLKVLFQTIQFSISTAISSIQLIDRTISGATTSVQSGTGSNGSKGVLCVLQSSSIRETSQSDYLVSYPGHSLEESYLSEEM